MTVPLPKRKRAQITHGAGSSATQFHSCARFQVSHHWKCSQKVPLQSREGPNATPQSRQRANKGESGKFFSKIVFQLGLSPPTWGATTLSWNWQFFGKIGDNHRAFSEKLDLRVVNPIFVVCGEGSGSLSQRKRVHVASYKGSMLYHWPYLTSLDPHCLTGYPRCFLEQCKALLGQPANFTKSTGPFCKYIR